MNDIRETQGSLQGRGRRFGIVASRFNSRIVDLLVAGAVDCLRRHGVEPGDIHVVAVVAVSRDKTQVLPTQHGPADSGGR